MMALALESNIYKMNHIKFNNKWFRFLVNLFSLRYLIFTRSVRSLKWIILYSTKRISIFRAEPMTKIRSLDYVNLTYLLRIKMNRNKFNDWYESQWKFNEYSRINEFQQLCNFDENRLTIRVVIMIYVIFLISSPIP